MTTTTPARRPVVGLLLALAGLLEVLAILFTYFAPSLDGAWLGITVDAALALAFLLLFLGRSVPLVLRIFFVIATIGWAILAIDEVVSLGIVQTIGIWLALVGSLISGVLVLSRVLFSSLASVLFLLATIALAVVLLNQVVGPFLVGILGVLVTGLSALLLLVAGILIALRK
jgi:hypothetical protein